MPDPLDRVTAALAALLAGGEVGATAFAVATALAETGELDLDDLRQRELLDGTEVASQLLVDALPFGLATPLDRPRLRRDAYRFAAASGADEGTAVAAVGAALVAADLTRFDASMTAIRVRQSLLEDAPMALLGRFQLLDDDPLPSAGADDDAGRALQVALSATARHDGAGLRATVASLGTAAGPVTAALTGVFASVRAGGCDAELAEGADGRARGIAERLASLSASPA